MPSGKGLRRRWHPRIGYTYDGVNPTECQCNTSNGGCKCGKLESDKERERNRTKDWR